MVERWNFRMYTRGDYLIGELTAGGHTYRARYNLRPLWERFQRVVQRLRSQGGLEVGFSLKGAWESVKGVAQKAVNSKVWGYAEKAATLGAALPPPYGPALAGVAGGMKVTRGLVGAKQQIAQGNMGNARALVNQANVVAQQYPNAPAIMNQARAAAGPLYLALVR